MPVVKQLLPPPPPPKNAATQINANTPQLPLLGPPYSVSLCTDFDPPQCELLRHMCGDEGVRTMCCGTCGSVVRLRTKLLWLAGQVMYARGLVKTKNPPCCSRLSNDTQS